MRYSKEDKLFWVEMRNKGLGYKKIATQFKKTFPSKPKPVHNTIKALIKKFKRTGSVNNIAHGGRKISKETEMEILAYVEVNLQYSNSACYNSKYIT